jgi:succinate dehydrogenase/fumarate reductase flavoprotein subunit
MNDNYFTNAVLAIVMGTGAGMLLSAGAQQLINKHHIKTCPAKPGHQLIYTQGFLGDAFYCLDKRTL